MKRALIAVAGAALVPLAAGSIALGQGSTQVPNTNRVVNVQAGNTAKVILGKVNSGTGYAWKWVTKPDATVAKGLAVRLMPAKKGAAPGSPRTAWVPILGLAEDMKTTGVVGFFGPGQASPERTITLKITVTGDGQ